jgi:small GTP-binding protein
MRSLKVVLVGDTKVGKSCILNRFVQGTFDRTQLATVGAAYLSKVVTTSNGPVRLQLWDTAGQEKFKSLAPMYYRSASVAVLVYDVTTKSSLDGLEDWNAEIADKAPHNIKVIVVGNKTDLAEDRVVPTATGEEIASRLHAVHYRETSAETGVGIDELFREIAEFNVAPEVITQNPPPPVPDSTGSDPCC